MKCKVLVGRNALQLEELFNKWMSVVDMEIFKIEISTDRGGNYMWAVFYTEFENAEEDEQNVEEEEQKETEEAEVLEPAIEVSTVEALPEIICPSCQQLTKPTVVQRGPYAGRYKCTECKRTFVKEDI